MKVHEIAATVGMESAKVAEELGLGNGQGVHLKTVDDAVAQNYIASKGVQAEKPEKSIQVGRKARFWSEWRRNILPCNPDDPRGHIETKDWVYACDTDSPQAKFLRKSDVRDRMRIFEVLPVPYKDAGKVADFIRYLERLVFSGQTPIDGASREGRDKMEAILFPDMQDELAKEVRNSPRALARAVASKVSLSVETFNTEE